MTISSRIRRSTISALASAIFALAMIFGAVAPAAAQQQGITAPPPQIVIPHSQGKETSTLELPSMPAPQGGASLNIPPTAPQTGQSLEVPTRELRQQPGYEQVTVTVRSRAALTSPACRKRISNSTWTGSSARSNFFART